MKFHIITLFPEAFESFFEHSMVGRAKQKGLFEVETYNLCDASIKPTRRVDDKAYGMHGQVISPEPLANTLQQIFTKVGKTLPVVYMTPSGETLNQENVEQMYENIKEMVIICGHYEGIDQRIIDRYVDYEVSIGNYVLSGGELAAQVYIDSLIRNIPGVLGNTESLEEESFSKRLERKKEYPVYTRPEEFDGMKVPEILLSGDHKKIEDWKRENLR
ncbi:tRNA (guanosine(37)-N1)-methyltransferase TrmD [Candidatus Gracilibacteria bacterium]|nr:tRNA (guanosine(37)-N1)-methyltransferase TrmD [Candidatus Gracilibacteria bacterium]